MAGLWIVWTKGLTTKRELAILASKLNRDRHEIAGRLMLLWEWVDDNFTDDDIKDGSYDVSLQLGDNCSNFLDSITGLPGLTSALASPEVGWLKLGKNGLVVFPNLARHNGTSAKTRAYERKKKQIQRGKQKRGLRPVSPKLRDNSGTTEENRTEQKTHHHKKHDDDAYQFDPLKPDPAIAAKLKHESKVIEQAWHVACLFMYLNPMKRNNDTILKIVSIFAGHISAHGPDTAVQLKGYYSLTDPAAWQTEVDSKQRLAIGANPLDVCNFLFPKAIKRLTGGQSPPQRQLPNLTDQRRKAEKDGIDLLNSGKEIEEVMEILEKKHGSDAAHAARSELNKHIKGKN